MSTLGRPKGEHGGAKHEGIPMSSTLSTTHPLARMLVTIVRAQRPWQLLLFVLIGVVCYLAITPNPPKSADLGWDKLNHATAFATLTVAGCFAFPGSWRTVLWVLLGLLALGGLIEVVQYFVPGRNCELLDVVADAVGMGIGATVALLTMKLVRRAEAAPA